VRGVVWRPGVGNECEIGVWGTDECEYVSGFRMKLREWGLFTSCISRWL
jgi:hypothetical protein